MLYSLVMFATKNLSFSVIKTCSKFNNHCYALQRHYASMFGHYDIVKPGNVSPMLKVPDHIVTPEYYETGEPPPTIEEIRINTAEEIERIRASCQLARRILNYVGLKIKVGMTTDEIDKMVHNMAVENGAYPSPLNYKGFPKSVCTSVNNVACHGIPDDRPLHEGDIINVDVTVYLNGYHGDCSSMFLVGNVDNEGVRLVNVTLRALESAIAICRPGENINSIGYVIEDIASRNKLSIIPIFTGHGVGAHFHEPPDIFHCYNEDETKMEPGMVFTIEPILSEGSEDVYFADDDWSALTNDNGRAAQWEHTVLITKDGNQVLTR